MAAKRPAWEAGCSARRCPTLLFRILRPHSRPLFALLIATGELEIHAEIPIQVRLRTIEIEVANRNAAQVAAQLRINRLADNAVHARERADVDDAVGAFAREVDHLADVQHHLAEGALARQVGARALQYFVNIRLFVADEILAERFQQHVLVALLHAVADPGFQRLGGPQAAGELELAKVLRVGIPDPFHDVGEPGFGGMFFQTPHQVSLEDPTPKSYVTHTLPGMSIALRTVQ